MSNLDKEHNRERANWAKAALKAYASGEAFRVGKGISDRAFKEDAPDIVREFLADLLHLCDQNDVDYWECIDYGLEHYTRETTPGPTDSSDTKSSDQVANGEEIPDEGASQPESVDVDNETEEDLLIQEIVDIFQPNRPGASERRAKRRERE